MKIWVVLLDDTRIQLEVKATDTIRKVKEMVQEKSGIPADQQIATVLRTELKDDKMLMEYGFHKVKKLVILDFYRESERWALEVRQAEATKIYHERELEKILQQPPELRKKLEERIAYLYDKLGYTQKNSDSEQSASHAGKAHLLSWTMKIWVVLLDDTRIQLEVKATDTIRKVKEMVQEKSGIPADQQIATVLRTELKDDKMLMEYGFHKVKKLVILDFYRESERWEFEVRQAEATEIYHERELNRILQQPPELRKKLEERVAFLKDKLGYTQKNSDSEQSASHSGLRRRRVAND
ncbi:Polyubiquitin-B, protein [Aphelenchoides besseyi]|nr:Polyubiquitin-B, protein [Aphelenchoides besseyi]